MENTIYEKDYHDEFQAFANSPAVLLNQKLVETMKETGAFQQLEAEFLNSPMEEDPEGVESYRRLLQKLDALAKECGGKIRAEVDRQRWEAEIKVNLPFFEFSSCKELELLGDLAASADYVAFLPKENGVELNVLAPYFRDVPQEG